MAKNFISNRDLGSFGENLAKEFLIKKKFKIIDMNYHYSKNSEIDIIASKDNILHFVEVKTRTQNIFGEPVEAITPKKLSSIYKCAVFYMQNHKNNYKSFQIDAIGILLSKDKEAEFKFIENISL